MTELGNALDATEVNEATVVKKPDFTWSDHQEAIFEFVKDGTGNAVVDAVAGSGKTTTIIEALGFTDPGAEIAFLAFNKRIADELRDRSPDHVHVSTLHSLGLNNIRASLGYVKVEKNKMWMLWDEVLEDAQNAAYKAGKRFNKEQMAEVATVVLRLTSLLKATLMKPSVENMHWITDRYSIPVNGETDIIFYSARSLWKKSLATIKEMIDFDDMIFAPAYGVVECSKFDFLFVDEAQDLNKSQIQFVLRSIAEGGRVVAVGDPHQCHPAGTLVAISSGSPKKQSMLKPIEELEIGDELVGYASRKSYFTGTKTQGRKVLKKAVREYTGQLLTVTTGRNRTQCTTNHRWLTRISKSARSYYALYLMTQGLRARIGIVKMHLQAGNGVATRARQERADKAWLLNVYATRDEAVIAEAIAQAKYGIPGLIYMNRGENFPKQENINAVYQGLGSLITKAENCLNAFGRDFNYPLWSNDVSNYHVGLKSFLTPACNLIAGVMETRTFDGTNRGGDWSLITQIKSQGVVKLPVYSLSVEPGEDGRKLYIAGGMVVGNSIYGFRGADAEAIPNLIEALNPVTLLPLSITYRCPTSVVELAQEFVPHLRAREDAPEGEIRYINASELIMNVEEGDLVICRVNAPLVKPAFELIRAGIKAVILGREIGKGLTNLMDKVGKRASAQDLDDLLRALAVYRDKQVAKLYASKKFTRAANLDDQIETIIALADSADTIQDVKSNIYKVFADDRKGVTFSSIHKIKGGEAERVFILHPEKMPHPMAEADWEKVQEDNIQYVALSRAKQMLVFVHE